MTYLPRAFFAFWLLILVQGPCLRAQDSTFAPAYQGIRLVNNSYLVDFDEHSRIAHWVHYELLDFESMGTIQRTDDFRRDGRSARSAGAENYRGSGYDRGHLKPAGDSKSSAQEMSSSFLMTNMAPQTPSLNRGIWRLLEQDIREWAVRYCALHVSTGPSLETKTRIGQSIRVPAACWKAILRTDPDTCAIAFMMPNNEKVEGSIEDYVMTVDELESLIQIDLFPQLPDSVEKRIESALASDAWEMSSGGGFNRSGLQCLGITTAGHRCGNFTSSGNQYCHLHQPADQPTNPNASPAIDHGGRKQCSGMAKSTGKRCRNMTTHPSGRCGHHRN